MDAKALYVRDAAGTACWTCSSCQALWFREELAQKCCRFEECSSCSRQLDSGSTLCKVCTDRDRVVREEELLKSAIRVSYVDYEEPFLFWSGASPDGEFFRDRTSIEKHCVEHDLALPRWVWGCEPVGFLLNAEDILAGTQDRTQQEIRHMIDDDQVEQLQTLLDEWAMKQEIQSFDVDYTTAVILDKTMYESVSHARPAKDE